MKKKHKSALQLCGTIGLRLFCYLEMTFALQKLQNHIVLCIFAVADKQIPVPLQQEKKKSKKLY